MFADTIKATDANIPVNTAPLTYPAKAVPITTPIRIGMLQLLSKSVSTLPRLKCARAELIEVGIIVASDVPTATCMRTDSSMPR